MLNKLVEKALFELAKEVAPEVMNLMSAAPSSRLESIQVTILSGLRKAAEINPEKDAQNQVLKIKMDEIAGLNTEIEAYDADVKEKAARIKELEKELKVAKKAN